MKKCPQCGAVAPETAFFCDCGHHFSFEEDIKLAPQEKKVPNRNAKWDRVLFVVVALYLVITFVRGLFPIAEMPRQSERVLKIFFELALAVGLIGLGLRILKAVPRGAPGRRTWIALFVAGLVSLLGIFAIHLSGGQRVEWSPRFQSSTEALPADLKAMVLRMEALVASFQKAEAEATNTRWIRTARDAPSELRKLSRADLRESNAKQHALLDAIDRMLQFLAEPRMVNEFNRVFSYAESQGLTGGRKRPEIDPHPWRLLRQVFGPAYELNKIVEENWEEWRLIESPQTEAELKPWQKEVNRLAREAASAQKQLEQLPD